MPVALYESDGGDDYDKFDPLTQFTVADVLEFEIARINEAMSIHALVGTYAIASYQLSKAAVIDERSADMMVSGQRATDDLPIRRASYLFDPVSESVNYIGLQESASGASLLIEELSSGIEPLPWTGGAFGDTKSLVLDATTGRQVYGRPIDCFELEQWNTRLVRSLVIDGITAKSALAMSTVKITSASSYEDRRNYDRRRNNLLAEIKRAGL